MDTIHKMFWISLAMTIATLILACYSIVTEDTEGVYDSVIICIIFAVITGATRGKIDRGRSSWLLG